MKKVIVFLADGFEEIEAVTVIDYLRRAEADVRLIAIPSTVIREDCMVEGAHGIMVKADLNLEDFMRNYINDLPDAVFVPGGMPGAANVGACADIINFIKTCCEAGTIVSAICAAPAVVLAKTGILQGKNYTCYPGMEEGLSKYCGSPDNMMRLMKGSKLIRSMPFVADGNVLTGRGPGTAEQFAMELVTMLFGAETADRIKRGSLQR